VTGLGNVHLAIVRLFDLDRAFNQALDVFEGEAGLAKCSLCAWMPYLARAAPRY
jgi:hypothetical protein